MRLPAATTGAGPPGPPRPAALARGRRRWLIPGLIAGIVLLAAAGAMLLLGWPRPFELWSSASLRTYVGAKTCAGCHRDQYELWKTSDHARAMEPADTKSVLGDFDGATFTKDGVTSTFSKRQGDYFVRTDGGDGALHDYRVAFTFGITPLQQYLIEFPKGRYQIPSLAWDTRPREAGGGRWFHLHPAEKIDHRDPLHWTGPLQNWNTACAECHSTNLRRNYRPAEDRFETTWSDINVACEACHGPGSDHAANPRRALEISFKDAGAGRFTLAPGESIARRATPLRSRVEVETCGLCHSLRAQIWSGKRPGQLLAQTHRIAVIPA